MKLRGLRKLAFDPGRLATAFIEALQSAEGEPPCWDLLYVEPLSRMEMTSVRYAHIGTAREGGGTIECGYTPEMQEALCDALGKNGWHVVPFATRSGFWASRPHVA